eukprot:TRINITY_DN8422_c0_g1_i1.p1 TRINITY_DN8422_c0_g1~~TRINITY_DN8422_c0_g1_i1.p1  ORF type:complete len:151 (+),score=37.83 TRINITY_DN8422_c0_g1_i1:62-514(+)
MVEIGLPNLPQSFTKKLKGLRKYTPRDLHGCGGFNNLSMQECIFNKVPLSVLTGQEKKGEEEFALTVQKRIPLEPDDVSFVRFEMMRMLKLIKLGRATPENGGKENQSTPVESLPFPCILVFISSLPRELQSMIVRMAFPPTPFHSWKYH